MAKSAINILQEIAVKEKYFPTYNFLEKIQDGNKIFTCTVSCKQLNAYGVGNSKKEAKHNAARYMLLQMLNSNNEIPLPIDTLPLPSVTNVTHDPENICKTSVPCKKPTADCVTSAINLLQEISVKQGFMPIYTFKENIDTNDMPFICNVLCKEFNADGTGSSKKEAKHNAARNMLLLLDANNETTATTDTSLSPSIANAKQNSETVNETSKEPIQHNYIGLLQEYCQQRKIVAQDIRYQQIYDDKVSHLNTFTVEVQFGSLTARGTGKCKKTAKQEAARNMLLHLNSNVDNSKTANVDTADSKVANLNTMDPNIANRNVSLGVNKGDICNKDTLRNDLQKLGVEILDCTNKEETVPKEDLSEKIKSLYFERKGYVKVDQNINPFAINNFHTLFERNYSNKIPQDLKEKMKIIRDEYNEQMDLRQLKCDIEKALKVKIQQITTSGITKNHMTCLRLFSDPCITQFGMGKTQFIAESRAMYNLLTAILTFLNI